MSGLSKEQFDLLYECVKLYLHLVPYAIKSLVNGLNNSWTELLTFTVCCHDLNLEMMAFISDNRV